jgi:3-oxoadipate enol-lactonase / 4-carboxymuconolactone decarboxylase
MTTGLLGHDVHGPHDAPVLVLGGSLGADRRMWDPQLPELAEHFRVIRYDHLGHGESPVPPGPYTLADLGGAVLALLDHLGVARAHVAGLSLGGMVGMWLAAHHPGRVDRLALFCTSAQMPPAQNWLDRAATTRAEGTAAVADAVIARWFTPEWVRAHPESFAAHHAMLCAVPAQGYAACCEAIAAMDLRPDLPRIGAPTLVVAAADDPATPESHARVIEAGIRSGGTPCRVEVVAGAHLATVSNPTVCTRLLVDHLGAAGALPGPGAADLYARGMQVRRSVLGDAYVDRATAGANDFTRDFQEFVTAHVWGAVWTRPGLGRRERSLVTVALLAGLGRAEELPLHVRGALNNGVTVDELREVLLHTAAYAGAPASNTAFAVARQVLDEIATQG